MQSSGRSGFYATAYKAWEPDYAFEADNRRTLEAFCTAFGIEVTEYVYDAYHHVFYWDADPEIKEIRKLELDGYIRHRLSLFEPTGFYLDDVILGPAKQPTEGKVFGNVIEECLEAFFSACCEDVKYTQSQEYFADFAENNEFEFYENDICIRHREKPLAGGLRPRIAGVRARSLHHRHRELCHHGGPEEIPDFRPGGRKTAR